MICNLTEENMAVCFNHYFHVQSTFEPHHEKTNVLHMRKQRRRSASQ